MATDAEPLARAICEACAQLHRPHAPLQDIDQANVRLIQLCEHAQAPQACLLIVRHGAQLVTQGAPVHACALAANIVERACRERNVSGDDAFALLEALDNNEAGDACAGAVCAGVAFWSVEAGQEAAALDRCAQRPVALAIAVAEELERRGARRDAGGAWRALARGAPSIARLTRCVAAWAACGACLRGAPSDIVGALLQAALREDADATLALSALIDAEPPLPSAEAVAPYEALVTLAVAEAGADAADARASLAAALLRVLAAPVAAQMARGELVGARLLEGICSGVGADARNVASTSTDAMVAFLEALPDRTTFGPPWRRPLASAVVRAAAKRASDAFYATGRSFEDRDDATFNRLYHAGPCLYQLALALDEADVDESELLLSAPWLEAAVEAVFCEEEASDTESD